MQKELLSMAGSLLLNAVTNKNGAQGKIENRIVRIDAEDFVCQVYVPEEIQAIGNLPVIIFLHGIGQRGSGGFVPKDGAGGALVRHYFAQVPAIILLPQCRQEKYWSDSIMDKMVMHSLAQTIEEFGADASRVYLTGVSMGGYGVWHLAAQHPKTFAALVSICGGSSITTGDRFAPLAERVGKTPAWLFHGANDKIVQPSESRQIVSALEANGGNVKYSEYPNVGHNVWMNALGEKDLMSWLLAQHLK